MPMRHARQARRRQVRLQQSPLLVAHIACVTQVLAAMPPTGGRGPHEAVQIGFDNRPESHLAPAIHPRQTFRDSLLAVLVISAAIFFSFAYADRIQTVLGQGGTEIAVRLSAFILFCIGVQILWAGGSELIRSVLQP